MWTPSVSQQGPVPEWAPHDSMAWENRGLHHDCDASAPVLNLTSDVCKGFAGNVREWAPLILASRPDGRDKLVSLCGSLDNFGLRVYNKLQA